MYNKEFFKISNFLIRILIFFFIVFTMIRELIKANYRYFSIAFVSILIIIIIEILLKKRKIAVSTFFLTILYIFILISSILGEIYHFYIIFSFWDILVHLASGFILAVIANSLIKKYFTLKASIVVIIFIISFSLTGGVCWEFKEYITDKVFMTDEQKDTILNNISSISFDESQNFNEVKIYNIDKVVLYHQDKVLKVIEGGYLDIGLNDTMTDLFWDSLGAIFYCLIMFVLAKKENVNTSFIVIN